MALRLRADKHGTPLCAGKDYGVTVAVTGCVPKGDTIGVAVGETVMVGVRDGVNVMVGITVGASP